VAASGKSFSNNNTVGGDTITPIDPILIIEAPQTSQTNSYAASQHLDKSF
jgi:hypothetical protein